MAQASFVFHISQKILPVLLGTSIEAGLISHLKIENEICEIDVILGGVP